MCQYILSKLMVSFGVHNMESQWRGNAWVWDDEMDDRQILSKTSREKLNLPQNTNHTFSTFETGLITNSTFS